MNNKFMHMAILEALKAGWNNFVPIGAVIVKNKKIIFKDYNKEKFKHVELSICNFVFKNKIINYDIYLTQEPCIMCWYALHQTKVKNIFFGCYNSADGGYSLNISWKKKKKISIFGGLEKYICENIIKSFFISKKNFIIK